MKRKGLSAILIIVTIIAFCFPVLSFAEECDHEWDEWFVSCQPGCTNMGTEERYCVKCGLSESRDIPELGHAWGPWQIYNEATCCETGSNIRYCTRCGAFVTEATPTNNNHEWGEWEVEKYATIFKKGVKERYCEWCDAYQTKSTKKLKPFIKLNKKKISIRAKKSTKLKVSFARGDKVKSWKSSNTRVATVKGGKIVGKKKGKATITVKLKSGKTAKCKVTVKKAVAKKRSGGGGTVYWVPNGYVYHCTKHCRTLSRSRIIRSGSVSEAKSHGKSRPCKVCY